MVLGLEGKLREAADWVEPSRPVVVVCAGETNARSITACQLASKAVPRLAGIVGVRHGPIAIARQNRLHR